MGKTLAMKIHLYFVITANGVYLPNSGLTASFLASALTHTKSKEKLEPDEFEFLKANAKQASLVIHVFDGEKTTEFTGEEK